MAETSKISWTDATFNPWIGCTKVSPGCDHCYAERDNNRRKWTLGWGVGAPRKRTSEANWRNPIKWNRQAEDSGTPLRVFCASLADILDNEVPDEWRFDLWRLIEMTPHLRWLLLSKRIGNALSMMPQSWRVLPPKNVCWMATMVNQEEIDRDYRKLMAVPAVCRGISVEPMLGPIWLPSQACKHGAVDWIITGGESGFGFRMCEPRWVSSVADQCKELGIAHHHKQWSGLRPGENGCLVNGVERKAFPPALVA